MLIAIMGDSFANFMENKSIGVVRSKLQILSELAPVIKEKNDEVKEKLEIFMFVVRPTDSDRNNSSDTWNGSVSKITSVTRKQI